MTLNRSLQRARVGGGGLHKTRMNRTRDGDLDVRLDEKNQPTTRANRRNRVMTMLHEPGDVGNRRHGKHRLNSTEFQRGKRPSPAWMYALQERTMRSEDDVAEAVVVVAAVAEIGAVAAVIEVAAEGDRGKVPQEKAAADDREKVAPEKVAPEKVAVGDRGKVALKKAAVDDQGKVAPEKAGVIVSPVTLGPLSAMRNTRGGGTNPDNDGSAANGLRSASGFSDGVFYRCAVDVIRAVSKN